MNKVFLLLLLSILSFQAFAWKPLIAGHRGSSIGVENSIESFTNGADKFGYDGLECDIRVTSDGKYVISHDETTNRLGGSLTVANSTLAQLQAENYVQTRNGVEYKGKICTAEEYLNICKIKGVFPLIELKYTTGINTSSMSNFSGLMKLVEKYGLRDKAVFMTSMQYSLEYIRTNYPDVKCQYLISTPTSSRFDWCVKWAINPTYEAGCFDQNLLVRLHNNNLLAATWVVDSQANYEKYANMGVYMITTNSLNANNLADIADIDWDKFPEYIESIKINAKLLWSRSLSSGGLPDNFPFANGNIYKTGQQAAIVDGTFYVNDYGTSTLLSFDKDSKECTVLKQCSTLSGTSTHGITSDDAGNIIQRNENGIVSSPSSLLIYKKGEINGKQITFSLANPGQTNFITASGDVFSNDGGYVYLYPNKQAIVYVLHLVNGELVNTIVHDNLSKAANTAGYVIPILNNPNNFIYQLRSSGYYLFNDVNKGDYLTGNAVTTAPNRNSSVGGAFLTMNNHEILIHPSGTNYNGGFTIKDMTASGYPELASFAPLGQGGYTTNISCGTFMKLENVSSDKYILYTYTMGNGYAAYEISLASDSNDAICTENEVKVNLYPNPTNDDATITCNELINNVKIFSISGSLIKSYSGSGQYIQTISVDNLERGTYIISINDNKYSKLIRN